MRWKLSSLIVQGKVTKIVAGGFKVGQRPFDAALIDVSAVLKNSTGSKKVKQVRIAQPAAAGIAVSTDIRFRPGQTGIWLLTKDPQHNVYWAKHPSRYHPVKQASKLKKLVAARKKIPAGKPVKGLVVRSELVVPKIPSVNSKAQKVPKSYEIRVSLKNVSDKPITVCNFLGYQPLVVEWQGPGGTRDPKKSRSVHYAWLARARLAAIKLRISSRLPPAASSSSAHGAVTMESVSQPHRFGRRTSPNRAATG